MNNNNTDKFQSHFCSELNFLVLQNFWHLVLETAVYKGWYLYVVKCENKTFWYPKIPASQLK
jgi:hypothetical protein